MTETIKKAHHKHFTGSEIAAASALEELYRFGFLKTIVYEDMIAYDGISTHSERYFVYQYENRDRALVAVEKADPDKPWVPVRATIRIGYKYWNLARRSDPIPHWVAQSEELFAPYFTMSKLETIANDDRPIIAIENDVDRTGYGGGKYYATFLSKKISNFGSTRNDAVDALLKFLESLGYPGNREDYIIQDRTR